MSRKRINIDLAQVESLAGRGLTNAEICQCLGICETTLYERKRYNKDFEDALKRGRAKARAVIANALFEQAKNGNMTAIIWWEKTRCGLSDKQEHHHTVSPATVVEGYQYDSAVAPLAPPPEDAE